MYAIEYKSTNITFYRTARGTWVGACVDSAAQYQTREAAETARAAIAEPVMRNAAKIIEVS